MSQVNASLALACGFLMGLAWAKARQDPQKAGTLRCIDESDEGDESDDQILVHGVKDWVLMDGPFKLVLVVNMELKMGKGKVAAQCCHATLGCFKAAQKYAPGALRGWEHLGQAKICIKCPTQSEMMSIYEKAAAAGLPTYLVMDAGRTQIASGSRTVLGIGPAPESCFLGITDHLKLM
ncbi:unnamed protein product [Chrysoparadoxa australica]